MSISARRIASAGLAAPAAVIGTLAATIAVAPAEAAEARTVTAAEQSSRIRALAPMSAPTRGGLHVAAAKPATHVVAPGETVSSIARKQGVATADLLTWNHLGWRSVIYPGQKLRLTPASSPAKAAPAAKPHKAPAVSHTVVRGDTVYAIAKKYRTTVSTIMSLNSLGGSAIIRPGQKLRVAAPSGSAPTASAVASAKPVASTAPKTHTVTAGDTLFEIAKKYRTTVVQLLSANGLGEGSIIYPGQKLRLAAPASGQRFTTLDATQRAHAKRIIRIGRELGVPDRGIAIALATAMVESSMRNLNHGDRDSLGLFQQRPSQGWGKPAQLVDADRSIRVFYGGRNDPNRGATRGLLDITGWQRMPFTAAAQAVQVSAYPARYGQWEQQANRWLAELR